MAYEEHGMWEVLEVLKRIHRLESRRSVSRNTGRSRKTIERYVAVAMDLGWVPHMHPPDEALASEVISKLRPGPKDRSPSETAKILGPHKDQIGQWLKADGFFKKGLTLTKIHTLLERKGVEVSYSSLYRYAAKHFDFGRRRSTVRVDGVTPGEVAEVDFGRLGLIPDPQTGKRRTLHALVVTLVYSRHQYVHVTHSQKLTDLIAGIEEAWEFFGGVTRRVVLDNLKAAVLKADRYDPVFQRTFAEYADYRDFVIDTAVPGEPTHKPHVERQVPYVRENFFRGEHFLNRDHAQREAIRWCTKKAGMRIHGTTRKHPLVEFEKHEKSALNALNGERFDTPRWATPKVHPDFHIRFHYALYSVPYRYKGKTTTVRADSKLVRIYVGGELVKTHERKPPGKRSTDFADYPPEKTAYAMRDANHIIAKAKQRGEHIGRFAQLLLSGDFPWANLRQSQKLLRLTDKYGAEKVDSACRRALSFDLINVKRLEGIVKHALERSTEDRGNPIDSSQKIIQLPLRFLRDKDSFNHHRTKETE